MPYSRTTLASLVAIMCVACGPRAPTPQDPVAPVPESDSAALPEAPTPDQLAARAAEARALEVAAAYPPIEQYADDIYEGPALMASYQGKTNDGVYEGYGVLTLPDSGVVMAGLFARGFLNGPGTARDMQGELFHEGMYLDGVPAEYSLPLDQRPKKG
ncbi:hypothetical protein [Hyphomonas oceanitis]|uniref:Uncharacterized protein n=1 Tax=Hyphomonas oceanitis SCH89 TaxID=1280953 RepID=A0A059GCJ7_9PROT|nr:hypothetical protein [Hyphomonas oceanitis]KDA04449.1 hypothetical protein HOC_01160 [Hyphomonas oceanitis SCH89]